ncbi:hypothetical protein EX30DRAFT_106701 [Ascodesmis nigricans]|uniref:Uncharacterized protein n=1 Tax=Ascodesmis nigricans TaxID=341454 RepID=A0A4S2N562_9PEZI|nr:hypothetical protein EX30DRAFT_106701 [Ascodesmis nigricans]
MCSSPPSLVLSAMGFGHGCHGYHPGAYAPAPYYPPPPHHTGSSFFLSPLFDLISVVAVVFVAYQSFLNSKKRSDAPKATSEPNDQWAASGDKEYKSIRSRLRGLEDKHYIVDDWVDDQFRRRFREPLVMPKQGERYKEDEKPQKEEKARKEEKEGKEKSNDSKKKSRGKKLMRFLGIRREPNS